MSSSMAATALPATATNSGGGSGGGAQLTQVQPMATGLLASAAQFREIHKNTWLKRLNAEGKKITVGPKKSERSWVVFCVHDDTEALLEGYAEPRQAAAHAPEWIVSLQDTLHISHALIPNSHEFEFVVTLSNEVVRFHAMSWEIMQEWVETLRSKLREMKILSPRENLYTKLPEIRAPLLPTRDPTSPLPAPPPVPAALVPGVERVVPQQQQQQTLRQEAPSESDVTATTTSSVGTTTTTITATTASAATTHSDVVNTISSNSATFASSMSNTLTQNLLNMLSDPISAYSEHLNGDRVSLQDADNASDNDVDTEEVLLLRDDDDFHTPLLRSATNAGGSVRLDVGASHRSSADQVKNLENLMQCERLIPRPHTSRSLSAGAADKSSRKQPVKLATSQQNDNSNVLTTSSSNNITELEISAGMTATTPTNTTVTTDANLADITSTSTAATDPKTNITIIQVSTNSTTKKNILDDTKMEAPKLPTKSITAEVFKFPDTHTAASITATKIKQHEYKSNVQIIPSNTVNSSTIQVLGQDNVPTAATANTAVSNQYSTPVKKKNMQSIVATSATASSSMDNHKITTVHVAGNDVSNSSHAVYGTCYPPCTGPSSSNHSTPKLPKKIILSANTSGITNISVNNTSADTHAHEVIRKTSSATTDNGSVKHNAGNVHYEKVFLSSSIPISSVQTATTFVGSNANTSVMTPMASSSTASNMTAPPVPPKQAGQWNSPRRQATTSFATQTASQTTAGIDAPTSPSPTQTGGSSNNLESKKHKPITAAAITQTETPVNSAKPRNKAVNLNGSPIMERRRLISPTSFLRTAATSTPINQPPLPTRPPFLTRGLTEAVITARPSRRDAHFIKLTPAKTKPNAAKHATTTTTANNNIEADSVRAAPQPAAIARTTATADSIEQRRRSSSTSDARNTRNSNNNEFVGNRSNASSSATAAALRIQQPPQPFRSVENGTGGNVGSGSGGGGGGNMSPSVGTTSPAAKRMTLREQQVMQLRREIMHPGGVRLQLRRKDCVGSIAWVDAFGAVWIAGWKQKEHPVLYNALHIGDQLLSIAGVTISTAAEANKIIRNTNTLFVEVLVRRMPFGRGYAIRREREGQCLGLIRDGNTSTIVDVVPNSLAARHGLPPKAQSCDGTTLTFWILTEINGRPLNLFFKEHEIADRLNSVGRDISILVQPSDLITKLKKQLKSLRSYKDYLVQ